MKKIISLLLSLTLAALMLAPAFAAETQPYEPNGVSPTIYVLGFGSYIYDEDGNKVGPVDTPEGYLSDAVKDCIGAFAKAYLTGSEEDLEAYKEKLLSWVAPLYEDLLMGKDGYQQDNYHIWWQMPDKETNKKSGGTYPLRGYVFTYDWRLSPYDTAEKLARYVDIVLEATGAERVNLIGRCEGSCHVMTYLAVYGHDKVNKVLFHNPSCEGYLLTSGLFSGKLHFDATEIDRWLENNEGVFDMPEGEIFEMIKETLDLFATMPGIDPSGLLLDDVYQKVLYPVLPDVLLATYATYPGMWAMVSDENFDDAISYVFSGREEEYAGLIERVTAYHDEVQTQIEEIIGEATDDGVQAGVMTKYGYPSVPIFEDSTELSDGFTKLTYSSLGATTSTHTGTLDEDYIALQEGAGLGKYISPDKKVDASTCILRDTTWIVGGLIHNDFPDSMETLAQTFLTSPVPMTVDLDPRYPQFMLPNGNFELVPMTEENASKSTVGQELEVDFSDSLHAVIARVRAFIEGFIRSLRELISGIVGHAKGTADPVTDPEPTTEPEPAP
ncbi:MAG: hypothetical protein IK104_05270 [Clostridia bacterium]|nr:hypothetical protein [Clostridia bacterium]